MKTISVIVPVYNAEAYLNRCVESILNQSYPNLEVLLVNDGSTDHSLTLCHQFEANDSRVKVFDKENGGQSTARNVGLNHATGDFITFVDSDDWIAEGIYDHTMSLFDDYETDIVAYKCIFVSDQVKEEVTTSDYRYEVIEKDQLLKDYLYKGQTEKAPFSVCRKVFKKTCFDGIRFIEGVINEDIILNYAVLKQTNRLVHTDKIGYYYYQSPQSTTRNGLREKDFDLLKACDALKEMSIGEGDDVNYLVDVKTARSYFSLLAKIAYYGVSDANLDEKKVTKELTKQLRSHYKLLVTSPMPVNRKLMMTALAINVNLLKLPLAAYKKVRG